MVRFLTGVMDVFSTASRAVPGSMQQHPPSHWLGSGVFFPKLKWRECEADLLLHLVQIFRWNVALTLLPPSTFMACRGTSLFYHANRNMPRTVEIMYSFYGILSSLLFRSLIRIAASDETCSSPWCDEAHVTVQTRTREPPRSLHETALQQDYSSVDKLCVQGANRRRDVR